MGKKKGGRPGPPRRLVPAAGATPEETAEIAGKRCSAYLKEVHQRYPGGLSLMHQMAAMNGGREVGQWPDWCWVPMSAAYRVVSGGGSNRVPLETSGDIGRIAALSTWRLTKGVYRLENDRLLAQTLDRVWESKGVPADLRVDRDRFLHGLPQHCVYVVFPTAEHPTEHPLPLGVFIHLEHDLGNGRPELRFVIDYDGTWEGLVPTWVALDRLTLDAAAREFINQAAVPGVTLPAAARWLLPEGRTEEQDDLALQLARLRTVLAWPIAEMLTDVAAVVTRAGVPGEHPAPAAAVTTDGSTDWPIAQQPTQWVVSADVPRAGLHSV
ncbi:hypothetical protein ACF08W_28710 [Streptomyces sp. NPDC015144]|uniref:hypothetical protein n=1 Tax=Streptomyces sp. NPDC015144 TaxID=3364944 RepID=UPI0037035E88